MNIAILGAPGTGKTTLALALQSAIKPPLNICDAPLPSDTPQQWDLVLLMGLDLPASDADLAQRRGADQRLRAVLQQHGTGFSTVYGSGDARTRSAQQAIDYVLGTARADTTPGNWKWNCEKCSDPDCEHRLFSALLHNDV